MEREIRRIRLEEDSKDLMCNLPEGIAADIFSRVPFTTVVGCFRVKKSWLLMMKGVVARSDFAENHLANMLKKKKKKKEEDDAAGMGFFLLIHRRKSDEYMRTYFAEHVQEYSYQVNRLPCPPNWAFHFHALSVSMDYKEIVGSCNGLICLSKRISIQTVDYDPIYIYNPVLKEYLDLPPISNYNSEQFNKEPTMASGFGFYTTITTDNKAVIKYKVVRIYYRGDQAVGGGEVQVYTLGEGKWKTLEEKVQYKLQSKAPGVLLNGSLYWLIEKKDEPLNIVAFNLSSEHFYMVQPPELPSIQYSDTWTQFKEFEGKLCLSHVSEGHIKFWIRVGATWIVKELTLSTGGKYVYFTPIAFRKNLDEILLSCTTTHTEEVFSFYHFEENDDDALVEVMRMKGNLEEDAVPHTNSFISLKVMGEDGRRMTEYY